MTPLALKGLTPLDPMDVSKLQLLYNLQGNILKGHGRDHTTHIFICFKDTHKEASRTWLKEFAKAYVTCFQQQLKERELFKRNETIGGLFASVFLSKKGYEYLGFKDVDKRLKDPGFKAGMKGRLSITNDPPISEWENGFHGEIHVMILLADDDLARMGETATKLLKGEEDSKLSTNLEEISEICSIEYGHVIRNANGDGIEHFGYVDGVSQPLFLKDEVDNYMKFHNINLDKKESSNGANPNSDNIGSSTGNELKFDPRANADLVLIPDPFAPDASDEKTISFGSYFVFRKLDQNVKGFKEKEEGIGNVLYPNNTEIIGAYLVGRSEDGTPVEVTDIEGLIGSGKFNNFDYKSDPSGGRCPHFAHIRKTNPREDIGDVNHKKRIMARRGIPYGHRAIDTVLGIDPSFHQMPEGGVGLLFMSYQKSIEDQFEAIQKEWANDANFPAGTNTGIDPIIGQKPDQNRERSYRFPKKYGSDELHEPCPFEQFVHMKGGEYFFAPSMSFLKNIDTIPIP